MQTRRLDQDGLVPGGHEGDLLLYSPTERPGDGDLAIVELEGSEHVRRMYVLPDGRVQLVHAGGKGLARIVSKADIRIVGRVRGLLFGT